MTRAPLSLMLAVLAGLAFLHIPLLFIVLYAFTTEERSYAFPPPGYTLKWFAVVWERSDIWAAVGLSLRVSTTAHRARTCRPPTSPGLSAARARSSRPRYVRSW